MSTTKNAEFPKASGLLFGLGLGGFFDGIVLHQVLQWHHMVSSWYPPSTLENLRLNTLWDGVFHSATYVFVIVALYLFWKVAHRGRIVWSGRRAAGLLLVGWGAFNVTEGLVDHWLLGIHHVNETVPRQQWLIWDLGFLTWGALMLLTGWLFMRVARRQDAIAR